MKKTALIAFLVGLNIPKTDAERLAKDNPDDGEDIPNDDLKKISDDYKINEKELLKNDKEFVGDLKKDQYAIAVKQIESKMKKSMGLTYDETKDLKTVDEVLEAGVKKLTSTTDATKQQLQDENLKLTNEIQTLKEVTIPEIETRSETVKKELLTNSTLEKAVGTLDKKLLVGMTAAMATLKEKLGPAYEIGLDDKNELTILTKGDRLKPKSKDGSKFLSPKELIQEILDEEKLLENSGEGGTGGNGGGGKGKPATGTIVTTGKEDEEEKYRRFPHLKAAEEHMAKQKAELEKNKGNNQRS